MDQPNDAISNQEPPLGHHEVKLDEKGRMKLPARLKRHLAQQYPGERVFVTSIDLALGRIFPLSVWKSKLEKLERAQEDQDAGAAEIAELTVFRVNKYGLDQAVDEQGRLMIPPKLRDLLKIRTGDGEPQPIWLEWTRDGITIYNEAQYEKFSKASEAPQPGEKNLHRRLGL